MFTSLCFGPSALAAKGLLRASRYLCLLNIHFLFVKRRQPSKASHHVIATTAKCVVRVLDGCGALETGLDGMKFCSSMNQTNIINE